MKGSDRMRVGIAVLVVGMAAGVAPAAEPAAVLHLTNGGRVPGTLLGSDDPGVIRWRAPAFAEPLAFPTAGVQAVHSNVPLAPPQKRDEYGVELLGGDVVYGTLAALTGHAAEVESEKFGRLRVRRDQVRRVFRRKGGDVVYVGPNGLAGWKDPADKPNWKDEGGQLLTDQYGAAVFSDVGLPDRAVIELEVSWRLKPDFTLALGTDEKDAAVKSGFRFEVLDGELVVIGESARDADIAVVEPAGPLGGQVRLTVYLDQPGRKLTLVSRTGKLLATLNIGGADKPHPQSGVRLSNGQGDVRLEYLRVDRWNGVPPHPVHEDKPRLHRADGSVVYGELAAFDPAAKTFTVRDGSSETVVRDDAVTDVFLRPAQPDDAGPRTLRVECRDGSRFSGAATKIEDDHVTVADPGIAEPVRLPLAEVRSLVPLRHGHGPTVATADARPGRLEADGLTLKGRIVDAGGRPDVVMWQPDLASAASPLVTGISGRVIYRDPPPPPPPAPPVEQAQMAGAIGAAMGIIRAAKQPKPQPSSLLASSTSRKSMHLRTGDTVPAEIVRIDERGVTFRSPNSDATFVPHEKVKGVELVTVGGAPSLDEIKRARLLTLPRMQKDSPPTHLICSKTGDFLRGRIVDMDQSRLLVEVRLETKEVPRDRVAQIIWLHPDELGDAKKAEPPAAAARETRAQTVNAAGNRLTFVVHRADAKTIAGTSDVLGECRSTLTDVDQVLFGSAIEQSASQLAYHAWKLHHAVEPKFVSADAAKDAIPTGTESALVGQPAPAFQLEKLDGSKFKLADRKGQIVVLDFWATWCGPCMQTMPLVEGVIAEFADRKVELLAVNMEEQADQVKSLLERHKFKVPVAIDRDGAVAAKYAVTAIPQTVIIDREGKVARLFVGGGKATADGLRKALEELTK